MMLTMLKFNLFAFYFTTSTIFWLVRCRPSACVPLLACPWLLAVHQWASLFEFSDRVAVHAVQPSSAGQRSSART